MILFQSLVLDLAEANLSIIQFLSVEQDFFVPDLRGISELMVPTQFLGVLNAISHRCGKGSKIFFAVKREYIFLILESSFR